MKLSFIPQICHLTSPMTLDSWTETLVCSSLRWECNTDLMGQLYRINVAKCLGVGLGT